MAELGDMLSPQLLVDFKSPIEQVCRVTVCCCVGALLGYPYRQGQSRGVDGAATKIVPLYF